MANPLKRNLKVGDMLVMRSGHRVKVTAELFGNHTFTSGSAIAVNGERADAYDIDVAATVKEFSGVNGWDAEDAATPTA